MGHIAITGIVNASGWMEHLALQTTRLSTVITMADMITRGILYSLSLMGYELLPGDLSLPSPRSLAALTDGGN